MDKVISMKEATALIKDGMTLMVGGFLGCGGPNQLMSELAQTNVKNLTVIANDTAFENVGMGKLIVNKQIKKVIASHIGTNKETGRQMSEKETEVILVPQGTLAEQVRAGGAGLGGVLTPTGVGTIVEEGKQKVEVDGKTYLLEKPLRADVAVLRGSMVDKKGNVFYDGTTKNFNALMALSADKVIVETEKLVEVGEIDPNLVMTPGVLVDHIVVVGGDK